MKKAKKDDVTGFFIALFILAAVFMILFALLNARVRQNVHQNIYKTCMESRKVISSVAESNCGELQDKYNIKFTCSSTQKDADCWTEEV